MYQPQWSCDSQQPLIESLDLTDGDYENVDDETSDPKDTRENSRNQKWIEESKKPLVESDFNENNEDCRKPIDTESDATVNRESNQVKARSRERTRERSRERTRERSREKPELKHWSSVSSEPTMDLHKADHDADSVESERSTGTGDAGVNTGQDCTSGTKHQKPSISSSDTVFADFLSTKTDKTNKTSVEFSGMEKNVSMDRKNDNDIPDNVPPDDDEGLDCVDGEMFGMFGRSRNWSGQNDDVKQFASVRTMLFPNIHDNLVSVDFPYLLEDTDNKEDDSYTNEENKRQLRKDSLLNYNLSDDRIDSTVSNKGHVKLGASKSLDTENANEFNSSATNDDEKGTVSIKSGKTVHFLRDQSRSASWNQGPTQKEIVFDRRSLPVRLSNTLPGDDSDEEWELDAETKWIRNHVKCRVCTQFIPAPEPATKPKAVVPLEAILEKADRCVNRSMQMCMCGGLYKEHTKTAQGHYETNAGTTGLKWDYRIHTRQMMTNAFGEVEFAGFGGNIGKYIRVDVDTKMNDMLELMMKVWGMDKPNLLISVTGGAKNFKMSKRLKETFRRGLMKTALTTGAWIITGGTHAGVMKHVGEAVKDFGVASSSQGQVVTIGIASWGCVQNRHVLENSEHMGCWPAQYRIEKEEQMKQSFLDPNHSHFIFCDNGTHRKFAVEISFRARLENKIAQMRTDTGENAVSVPIVLLVLEGGPGTLETVHQAIQNNTPAVIVKGSGRAADILAYAYQNSKEDEIEANDNEGKRTKQTIRYMEDNLELEVIKMVEKEFGSSNTPTHMNRIRDCLNKGDFMSVFELDSTSGTKEIDVAMLQALLKANKNQVMDQLRLALAWNRIDVAKSDIFTDDKRWPTGSLDDVMLSAIQLNRVDFVELFLDHGVSLREFLTKKRMLILYNKIPKNCLLRNILTKVKARLDPIRKNFSLLDVGVLMQDLLGDYFRANYTMKEYAEIDVDNLLEGLTLKQAQKGAFQGLQSITSVAVGGVVHETNSPNGNGVQQQYDFENPTQELFIWSVMMIRQEMAKLFWVEGKDAIAAALVSYGLLRAMRKQTDDTELVNKIQDAAIEWSNLAVGVLNELHSMDEHKAQFLLVRELTHWGDSTCMLIAVKADNKEFIAQTPCQSLLNSIWMGKMLMDTSTASMLLCIICPLLAPFILKFHTDLEKTAVAIKYSPEVMNKQETVADKKPDQKSVLKRQGTVNSMLKRQGTFKREKTSMALNLHGSRTSVNAADDEEKDFLEEIPVPKSVYSAGEKIYHFFNAPVIIFIYNVISYLAFLMLFSYVLIVDFNFYFSKTEVVLIIWVVSILMEEVRQIASRLMTSSSSKVVSSASSTLAAKLQNYIFDTWNVVDLTTVGLFLIAMILRSIDSNTTYEASRVFLALNFVTFVVRLLHIFSVRKELGPKLVMIGRMVQDLMYFVLILMVFIVAYAVASYAILFPNAELSWDTVIAVIRRPYWNIYGELFLEDLEGDNGCSSDPAVWGDGSTPRCPTEVGKYVVPIMLGMYMLLSNVLLLNLLIAMFSNIFDKTHQNSNSIWRFMRVNYIIKYCSRAPVPPPLIIGFYVCTLVHFCWRRGRGQGQTTHFSPFVMNRAFWFFNVLSVTVATISFWVEPVLSNVSYTFQKVQDNTDKHWTYMRYSLIYEYYTRPVLCPPFIILAHIYLLIKFVVCCCCCQASQNNTGDDFRRKFRNERELVQWENVIADAFHHKTKMKATDSVEFKVNHTHKRLDQLMNRIEDIQEHQHQMTTTTHVAPENFVAPIIPSNVNIKMPPQLDQRLTNVEDQLLNTFRSLEWIIQRLREDTEIKEREKQSLEREKKDPEPNQELDLDTCPISYIDLEEMDEQRKKTKEETLLEGREKISAMMNRSVEIHFRSRQTPYLGTSKPRFPVPDAKVLWSVPFGDYDPPMYTSAEILETPNWSDPDLMQMSPALRVKAISDFNNVDPVYNCNRRSFLGIYVTKDGLPHNIMGRTGMLGRGHLGRFGPNHAGDPVVTRWKMKDGQQVMKHKKPVFEVVAVMRSDNQMWALPGAILPPGAAPIDHLQAEFSDEALGNFAKASDAKSKKKELKKLWKRGVLIYEGYADDPRNTDNAWLESTVFSYHDDVGTILNHFNLRAGNTVELATWLTASSKLTLHGSHLFFLKKTAEKLGAYF